MSTATITTELSFEGVTYPLAPMEPEKAFHPTVGRIYTITPEIARHWMRYNYETTNRNAREIGKRNYAADMGNGDWMLNGAQVTFTRPYEEGEGDGVPAGNVTVLDGQHRLKSCIASKMPFLSYVSFGFHPRVRPTVDTGIKRTLADTLKLRGEKESNVLASVASRCYAWATGDRHLDLRKGGVTQTVILDFLADHPEIRRSVEIAAMSRKSFKEFMNADLRQSTAGTAHWVIMLHDPDGVWEFFARLGDGDQLKTKDPINELRRRFDRDQKVKRQPDGATRKDIIRVPDWHHMCYYVRSYNARRIWQLLPEHLQEDYTFMMIGPKDSEEIPSLLTEEQVIAEAEKYIRRNS